MLESNDSGSEIIFLWLFFVTLCIFVWLFVSHYIVVGDGIRSLRKAVQSLHFELSASEHSFWPHQYQNPHKFSFVGSLTLCPSR